MYGRRYNNGLHQAIEAKEHVKIADESKTLATITFQNYFRMYDKLSGMTGTAMTEEDEFQEIYKLDVIAIPTNKPMVRKDHNDVIYKNENAKFRAVVEDIKESNIYTVKKGDSLWLIANKYGTTVDELKNANNLKSNTLSIGQTLIIPEKKEGTSKISYVVKKGDSLWLIANKYDTTVEKIKSTNNLKSNTLSIGQVLVIPSSSEFITYTVKKGDNLWLIANKYNTTVDNIKKLNNLSSNNLQINQKLILPA